MNNMYQYSLAFFFRLFGSALRMPQTGGGGVDARLGGLRVVTHTNGPAAPHPPQRVSVATLRRVISTGICLC